MSGAIQALLKKNINQPLRVYLNFSGCCHTSLCLIIDMIREGDRVVNLAGLTFVISPETYDLAGDITISYVDEVNAKGFRIFSNKPLGEWDGFGVTEIKF